jgi:Heparinase II/III-like protein
MHSSTVLPTRAPTYPRLFLDSDRLSRLKSLQQTDAVFDNLARRLFRQAGTLLKEPPTEFRIVGPRMLERAQQVLARVATLALAYQLAEREEYLNRARHELLAVREYPHWNPSHFLDTAELCTAFAIGLDWLRAGLSAAEHDNLQDALVEKGLQPGLEAQEKPEWWVRVSNNWNLVCNGGLAVGALAVADTQPELASRILANSVKNIPIALDGFAPDGAWEGGPHYWEYSAWYSALTIDALETSLSHSFGLEERPGLERAGLFPLHCLGPSRLYFNFADADTTALPQASLFWLGRHYRLPECVAENHRRLQEHPDRISAFDLIWYQEQPAQRVELPRSVTFNRAEIACMRTTWNDPQAFFIAAKAGSGQTDHAHLDLGAFVLDAAGVRWSCDLGPDDYDLPGYWDGGRDGGRWQYYRLNNRSHSTLVLNGHLQNPLAQTKIVPATFRDQSVVLDLGPAYPDDASAVRRGIRLIPETGALIQDEVIWLPEAKQHELRWQLTTDAEIVLQGNTALLTKQSKILQARILTPASAVFQMASMVAGPLDEPIRGFRQLIATVREATPETCVAVLLSLAPAETEVVPLARW